MRTTAHALQFSEGEAFALLEEFCTLEWVLPESIDMGDGPVRVALEILWRSCLCYALHANSSQTPSFSI